MEHQLSSFLRTAPMPATKLLYGITQSVPEADMATIPLMRDQLEAKLRKHFKSISYAQFFSDYSVDLARIGISLPVPGAEVLERIELTEEIATVLRALHQFSDSKAALTRIVAFTGRSRKDVLVDINRLIAMGLVDEDGALTEAGKLWLGEVPAAPKAKAVERKKEAGKVVVKHTLGWRQGELIQMVNLRCPSCRYFVKTTNEMITLGRPKCPVDGQQLLTKEERGEKKGRW